MFEFLQDYGNYGSRKIDRYDDEDGLMVSTCRVSDNPEFPFETAIAHPLYNNHKIIIVEQYTTEEDAQIGHDKWVKVMTAAKLPTTITDVSTCNLKKIGKDLGVNFNDIKEIGRGN